ncbi:exonuclease domain-containing protein [Kitasatospora sp. NPDC101801]|uniref:3'-5' exonuclease n=1 Tax=Kitasatospora sp. NPDC101801 TaxID=3364103 RepID=UPI003823084B
MTAPAQTAPAPERADHGPYQAADTAGIGRYLWDLGRQAGLIPAADTDKGRWSSTLVHQLRTELPDLLPKLDALRPLGSRRIAETLRQVTGLQEITPDDVPVLADLGLLRRLGTYEGHPTYGALEAEQWSDTDALAAVVGERTAWIEASLSTARATETVPWAETESEFRWAAEQRSLTAGRLGRWAKTDVEALATDTEVAEQVEGRRLIPGERAADYLDISYKRDWPYVLAAGWIAPAGSHFKQVGSVRTVEVKLYRTSDVLTLRQRDGVDWEAVRAVPRGRTSALRAVAAKLPSRAELARRLATALADRHGTPVHLLHDNVQDAWSINWTVQDGQKLTRALLLEAAGGREDLAAVARELRLKDARLRTLLTAREVSAKGAALVIDTETTDLYGRVCEIAVIDAASGKVRLNTLVNPQTPIRATHIHRITDADVADAPTWEEILPALFRITRGRRLLAYNSVYDRSVIADHTRAVGRRPGRLDKAETWWCLMAARSVWEVHRDYKLYGDHRALGDAQAARDVLHSIAQSKGLVTITPSAGSVGDSSAGSLCDPGAVGP